MPPSLWMSLHLLLLRLKQTRRGCENQEETPWGQCQACSRGWLWMEGLFVGKCWLLPDMGCWNFSLKRFNVASAKNYCYGYYYCCYCYNFVAHNSISDEKARPRCNPGEEKDCHREVQAVAQQDPHPHHSSSSTLLFTLNLPFSGYLAGFTREISLDKKIEKHLRIAKSVVVWARRTLLKFKLKFLFWFRQNQRLKEGLSHHSGCLFSGKESKNCLDLVFLLF